MLHTIAAVSAPANTDFHLFFFILFSPLLFLKFVSLFLYIQIRNREAPFLICFSVHKTGLNRSSTIFDIVYYVLPSVLSFWILLFYFTVRTAASDTTILPFVPVTTQRYFWPFLQLPAATLIVSVWLPSILEVLHFSDPALQYSHW